LSFRSGILFRIQQRFAKCPPKRSFAKRLSVRSAVSAASSAATPTHKRKGSEEFFPLAGWGEAVEVDTPQT
jgi:hypothetical protein